MQDERHRSIHQGASKEFVDRQLGSASHVPTVCNAKRFLNNRGNKEGRAELLCSHCGYTNHRVEKCFKLHGYLLGHYEYDQDPSKPRGRMQTNQVFGSQELTPMPTRDLTPTQCQQLIAFLSSKLQVVAESTPILQQQERLASMDISRTKVIGMGKRVGNLYLFINSTAPATVCNVSLNELAL